MMYSLCSLKRCSWEKKKNSHPLYFSHPALKAEPWQRALHGAKTASLFCIRAVGTPPENSKTQQNFKVTYIDELPQVYHGPKTHTWSCTNNRTTAVQIALQFKHASTATLLRTDVGTGKRAGSTRSTDVGTGRRAFGTGRVSLVQEHGCWYRENGIWYREKGCWYREKGC